LKSAETKLGDSLHGEYKKSYLIHHTYQVTDGKRKILVVINFSGNQAYAKVKVPDASSGSIVITEMMSNKQYTRSGDDMRNSGLEVVVDAWNG
jgi:hypothetical protein